MLEASNWRLFLKKVFPWSSILLSKSKLEIISEASIPSHVICLDQSEASIEVT